MQAPGCPGRLVRREADPTRYRPYRETFLGCSEFPQCQALATPERERLYRIRRPVNDELRDRPRDDDDDDEDRLAPIRSLFQSDAQSIERESAPSQTCRKSDLYVQKGY